MKRKMYAIPLLVAGASGHAMMYEPPSRSTGGISVGQPNCAGGCCLWFNNGAFIGCPKATGTDNDMGTCPQPGKPTNPYEDPKYGTIFVNKWSYCFYNPLECAAVFWKGMFNNVEQRNPWRAPGTAPVENPCGLNGGGYHSGPAGSGGEAFFGFQQGHKGTEVSPLLKQTTWIAGSTVEVAWGITANHGGGYMYRLCKVKDPSSNITAEVTEECFQKIPLEFVGDKQWIQFGSQGEDVKNRTEIPAVRLSKGTHPAGSIWTKNPIPGCNDFPRLGGHNHECAGPMFEPPIPGLYGFGPGACASNASDARPCTLAEMAARGMSFGIVDLVKVPENLPAGDYILGFRWDCEQLPQVWSNCADVKIQVKGKAKPTKAFSPWAGCEPCCANTLGACANCTSCLNKKDGACEYCWKPLKGFTFGAIPQYTCLGGEGDGGGPGVWKPGMPFNTIWSPGCPKCWSSPDSCKPSPRESVDDLQTTATVI